MHRILLRVGVWVSLIGAASAQLTYSSIAWSPPAQECDCMGTCPGTGSASGSGGQVAGATFDLDVSTLRAALGDDLLAITGQPAVTLGDAKVRFPVDSDFGSPVLLGSDGSIIKTLKEKDLTDLFKNSDAYKKIGKSWPIWDGSVFRVVEPRLKKSDFPTPVTLREQNLCKVAIRNSNSPVADACSEAVNALCPLGAHHASCTLDAIKYDLDHDVLSRQAGLLKYDEACLRSDLPEASPGSFNFGTIANRNGVLMIDPKPAMSLCRDMGLRLAKSGGVFCSAVAIAPDKLLTARHCFVSDENEWSTEQSCIAQGAIKFATFEDPGRPVKVRAIKEPAKALARTKSEDDYIVLELDQALPKVTGEVRRAKPVAFSPAAIVSYHDLVPPKTDIAGPVWRQKVRWGLPACSFTQVVGSCGVTKCQTIERYSGAAVWTLDETGATALAGLQSNGGGAGLQTCGSGASPSSLTARFNLAIWGYENDQIP